MTRPEDESDHPGEQPIGYPARWAPAAAREQGGKPQHGGQAVLFALTRTVVDC